VADIICNQYTVRPVFKELSTKGKSKGIPILSLNDRFMGPLLICGLLYADNPQETYS